MSSYIQVASDYAKISMHLRSEDRDGLVVLSSSLSLISIHVIELPVVFLRAPSKTVNNTVCLH